MFENLALLEQNICNFAHETFPNDEMKNQLISCSLSISNRRLYMGFNPFPNILVLASVVLLADRFSSAYGKLNDTKNLAVTPINHNLYHTSGALLEEIESLVHRHSEKLSALFMPYDHKNATPSGIPTQIMKSVLKDLNHFHLKDQCLIGSGGGSVGYLAHGTATDYMFDVARVPMAFTFEIYGDPKASSTDCFKMFNPIDITSFNRVLNEWSAAFFKMFTIDVMQMDGVETKAVVSSFDKWISIDDYLNGYLMHRKSRYSKKMEVLDLGFQEIRTYFRLFLLSSVLLLFMFCSRISKSARPIVASMFL
ncbi:Zn-dependent exopeptidases superfamily protein [Striga asiatica]|uniref:Zn-dependent exopeptidases superfamily protein n=1 Tax=Striga asiatica TaxID=4170 RepID=A0A5A7PNV0_STRAF|nr:Zn-dependent exopeptidases superfamily protein [Striga asiatica]